MHFSGTFFLRENLRTPAPHCGEPLKSPECSNAFRYYYGDYKFCSQCGAKIKGDEEGEIVEKGLKHKVEEY